MTTIGLLHPGAMGASIGAAARSAGAHVLWASAGRSDASARRATDAGLEDAGDLPTLLERSDVVISVCPPGAALTLADEVAKHRFSGLYLDANAISPATANRIAAAVIRGGARAVDGSIVGPPVRGPDTTRLYLSGRAAAETATLFVGSELNTAILDGGIGSASAMKMVFAGWTKGSGALLLAVRALARAEGVEDALLAEWAESIPELPERSTRTAERAAPKAWRFAGEMEQIADSFAAAGLPDGFHRASATLYRTLADLRDDPDVDADRVLNTLIDDV
jgi:3-hydroxyisobutyrate dehydrogenase-like beta-hydroxyacid dehydrogenase